MHLRKFWMNTSSDTVVQMQKEQFEFWSWFCHFGHLMWRADSLEKTLMLGKIEGRRRRGQQRMRWLDGINDSVDMTLSRLWDTVKDGEIWRATVHGVAMSQTRLRDWTKTAATARRSMHTKMKSSPGSLQLERKSSCSNKNRVQPKLFKKFF